MGRPRWISRANQRWSMHGDKVAYRGQALWARRCQSRLFGDILDEQGNQRSRPRFAFSLPPGGEASLRAPVRCQLMIVGS